MNGNWTFKPLSRVEKKAIIEYMTDMNRTVPSSISLSECEKDDILFTPTNKILRYVDKTLPDSYYDHHVIYPNNSSGTRIDDGNCFRNPSARSLDDNSIVGFIKIRDL